MAPLYNHGHADALSITLSVAGRPILVDPGTFRYNGDPDFRRYFKATQAHSTVTVDGEDQAVQETGFIWNHPFTAELTRSEKVFDGWVFAACHDGYRRLKEPVVHTRVVSFFEGAHFYIRDTFSGTGVHDFELNYHLHPNIIPTRRDGWWRLGNVDAEVFIRLLRGPDFITLNGQEGPPFGWFSPAYGVKAKSSVLNCRKRGASTEISFLTVVSLREPLSPDRYMERDAML